MIKDSAGVEPRWGRTSLTENLSNVKTGSCICGSQRSSLREEEEETEGEQVRVRGSGLLGVRVRVLEPESPLRCGLRISQADLHGLSG